MASPENTIGAGACPICASQKAKFTLSKSGLVCMTCNFCNCQIFARSGTSDEKLRARIRTAPASEPVAATMAPPAPNAPAHPTLPASPKNAPATGLDVAPKKGFGLLGAWA